MDVFEPMYVQQRLKGEEIWGWGEEFLHVKPGKGAAFVRTKLRNYISGNTVERTFRAGEQVLCLLVTLSNHIIMTQ
jgi:hypothetical protein